MRATILVCYLLAGTSALIAQESDRTNAKTKVTEAVDTVQAPVHYYRLNFAIEETDADGKPTNSRSYSITVSTDPRETDGKIRTGSRIPIATGSIRSSGVDGKLDFQYQYLDVGVNIDTRQVREAGSQLAFHLSTEISSLGEASPSIVTGAQTDPVIRQHSWEAPVIIPIGKPTVVFKSDALDSKGGMQLLVTATQLQ